MPSHDLPAHSFAKPSLLFCQEPHVLPLLIDEPVSVRLLKAEEHVHHLDLPDHDERRT